MYAKVLEIWTIPLLLVMQLLSPETIITIFTSWPSMHIFRTRYYTLTHGPLIQIWCGSNPDQIPISCIHMDRLIQINMWVKTTFPSGFNWHLIRIKVAAFSQTWWDSEVDALINVSSNTKIYIQRDNTLTKMLCFCALSTMLYQPATFVREGVTLQGSHVAVVYCVSITVL